MHIVNVIDRHRMRMKAVVPESEAFTDLEVEAYLRDVELEVFRWLTDPLVGNPAAATAHAALRTVRGRSVLHCWHEGTRLPVVDFVVLPRAPQFLPIRENGARLAFRTLLELLPTGYDRLCGQTVGLLTSQAEWKIAFNLPDVRRVED